MRPETCPRCGGKLLRGCRRNAAMWFAYVSCTEWYKGRCSTHHHTLGVTVQQAQRIVEQRLERTIASVTSASKATR